MPTLSGTLTAVTGDPIDPSRVRSAYVRAAQKRGSLGSEGGLVTTVPVPVSTAGELSIDLDPGPAILVVQTSDGGPDVFDLYVTEDMSLITEALAEAAPPHERSWVESQMVQLRGQTVDAAGEATGAAAQVAQDRTVVVAAKQDVEAALETANVFAQDQVPPYLQTTALNATYVQAWKPSTAYASGAVVRNPDGESVVALSAHTSGATFNASQWSAPKLATKAETTSTYTRRVRRVGPSVPALFTTRQPAFAVWREDIGGLAAYWLSRKAAGGEWDSYELRSITAATSGHVLSQLRRNESRWAVTSVDDLDASITYVGTWASQTDAAAFGGSYRREFGTTAGRTATWTIPAGATAVGARIFATTNGGYARVSIGESYTRADLLPTAQQEVDAGRLASTALVANGGILNPTDRLMSCYATGTASGKDNGIRFATGTDLAGATVVIETTNLKPAASSEPRVYLSAFSYSTESTTPTSGIVRLAVFSPDSSVWEHAMQVNAGNGTGWVGGSHGYDREDSLTILVNGQARTLTNSQAMDGDSIAIVRRSTLLDPGLASREIGKVTMTYSPAADGLRVEWQIEWLVGGTLAASSYTAMMPRNKDFNRAKNLGQSSPVTVTDSNGTFKANARSDAMLIWQGSGNYGSLLRIPDTDNSLNNMPAADALAVEDRLDGTINKLYAKRADVGTPETFAAGDYWRGGMVYATQRFDNPEAVLSVI